MRDGQHRMNIIGPENPPCPECGGERVKGDVSGHMTITPRGKAFVFNSVGLEALVCVECGYTSLYVIEPLAFVADAH